MSLPPTHFLLLSLHPSVQGVSEAVLITGLPCYFRTCFTGLMGELHFPLLCMSFFSIAFSKSIVSRNEFNLGYYNSVPLMFVRGCPYTITHYDKTWV